MIDEIDGPTTQWIEECREQANPEEQMRDKPETDDEMLAFDAWWQTHYSMANLAYGAALDAWKARAWFAAQSAPASQLEALPKDTSRFKALSTVDDETAQLEAGAPSLGAKLISAMSKVDIGEALRRCLAEIDAQPDEAPIPLEAAALPMEGDNPTQREEWLANQATLDRHRVLVLEARLAALTAELEQVQRERDEAVNWSDIVDRHGTDQFDDLADAWMALDAIQRVTNAVTSTFAKWANDDLMARFRQQQLSMFHMAFVEGCLAGVKSAESALSASERERDTTQRLWDEQRAAAEREREKLTAALTEARGVMADYVETETMSWGISAMARTLVNIDAVLTPITEGSTNAGE